MCIILMHHGLSYAAAQILPVATVCQNAHKATEAGGGTTRDVDDGERLPGIVMFSISTNRNAS